MPQTTFKMRRGSSIPYAVHRAGGGSGLFDFGSKMNPQFGATPTNDPNGPNVPEDLTVQPFLARSALDRWFNPMAAAAENAANIAAIQQLHAEKRAKADKREEFERTLAEQKAKELRDHDWDMEKLNMAEDYKAINDRRAHDLAQEAADATSKRAKADEQDKYNTLLERRKGITALIPATQLSMLGGSPEAAVGWIGGANVDNGLASALNNTLTTVGAISNARELGNSQSAASNAEARARGSKANVDENINNFMLGNMKGLNDIANADIAKRSLAGEEAAAQLGQMKAQTGLIETQNQRLGNTPIDLSSGSPDTKTLYLDPKTRQPMAFGTGRSQDPTTMLPTPAAIVRFGATPLLQPPVATPTPVATPMPATILNPMAGYALKSTGSPLEPIVNNYFNADGLVGANQVSTAQLPLLKKRAVILGQ